MVVSTATYSTTGPTYTATNFSNQIKQAFIDAGLMTAWFDEFTDGTVVNRIAEITLNAGKVMGKIYYWFQFSGADWFYSLATGWNATTHLPTGDQYKNYYSTSTNTTNNHCRLTPGFNANVQTTVLRVTSGVRADFSMFTVTNGSLSMPPFFIDKTAPLPLVDLDKVAYPCFMWSRLRVSGNSALFNFQSFPVKLRETHLGAGLRGITSATEYGLSNTAVAPWEIGTNASTFLSTKAYGWVGNGNGSTGNYGFIFGNAQNVLLVSVGFANVNDNYSAVYNPPFSGWLFWDYSSATLPSDFAIFGTLAANNLTIGTSFTVQTSPPEDYIILAVANGSTLGDSMTLALGGRI